MKGMKKRVILIHLIGAIVARAAFFGINPLAIGYFTAAYLAKTGGGIIFFAVMIGIATVMPTLAVLKYLIVMITTIVILEAPILKNRQLPKPLLNMIPPLALFAISMMEVVANGNKSRLILFAFLEAVIVFVSAGIFRSGIDYLLKAAKGYKMNNEQMISMAVTVAVIVYAIPELSNVYIAPVETVVFFLVLFFTYKYGVGQGAVTGAVCGLVLSLRGAPIAGLGMLCMMGIAPAVFRELGRVPTATIYMVTAALMGIVFEGMTLTIQQIGALVSAVLVFLLLPRSLAYRSDLENIVKGQEPFTTQNIGDIAKTRMRVFSDSFLKLAKTLTTITDKQVTFQQQEINRIFEDISEKLCKNCSNCSNCWENNFNETYQAASKLFDVAEKNGVVLKEDIPFSFADSCICADQFILETNRGFEIAKLNHIWHNRLAESREVIADHLKEVSTVIQDISSDLYGRAEVSSFEEEQIIRCLKLERIHIKSISVLERSDKRKEIYLNAACRSGRCVTAKEAAAVISNMLGIRMCVSEASKTVISKEYDNYIFIEDTKFKVLTGVARAMKDKVSGDNFSVLKMETGEIMIALSDGMGTGPEASDESEAVVSLLEQLIDAGFKAETAIKLINSGLALKVGEQTFSTIDMSIINLFTGVCEFIKIGAATTFIKRDNWVETISSTTMPIGMLQNVDYDTVTKKLYEGDIVIMVSDGVLDCIKEDDKEAFMERLIMELNSNNPQKIANLIMDRTLAQRNYVPMDDMTVITAGIWLK